MLRVSAVRSFVPPPPEPPTIEALDGALLRLRDTSHAPTARHALEIVKAAPRELVRERMAAVRPLPDGLVDPMGQSVLYPARRHNLHESAVVFQCAGDSRFHSMTQKAIDCFRRYADCKDTLIVVVCGDGGAWEYFRHRTDILPIRMTLLARPRTWMKSAMYCVPELVNAHKFLFLESDMVVIRSLAALWTAMDVADERTIFGVKPQYYEGFRTLADELLSRNAPVNDLPFVTGGNARADKGVFTFNGGTLAGSRRAFLDLAAIMRSYAPFITLASEGGGFAYADELYTMAAINQHGYISILGCEWNHHFTSFTPEEEAVFNLGGPIKGDLIRLMREGRASRIVHFVGDGKHKLMPQFWSNLDRLPVGD